MRQVACVPIAPAPSPTSSFQTDLPRCFTCDGLGPLDVLLKRGGRPTHGKKTFFDMCKNNAVAYASFKSPIDRRLLARGLVEQWVAQGGRFCTTAVNTSLSGAKGTSNIFRVASPEEALQFTRRVLVRHFTPVLNKKRQLSSPSSSPSSSPLVVKELPLASLDSAHHPPEWKDLELATSEAADALCFLRSLKTILQTATTAATTTPAPISTPIT